MAKIMNRADLTLTYEGIDISADVARYVTSFSYTDHEGGKADDLQVSLEDSAGLWKKSWFPAKGAILTARIQSNFKNEQKQLNCGMFAIDEISFQGPPDTIDIKGVSNFTAKSLKRETKTRGWEKISLKDAAARIAIEHGLTFYYDSSEVVMYERLDQREESDLSFLKRLCDNLDFNLKVSGEKLIIFESKRFELAEPVFTIVRGSSAIGSYNFATKTYDIYQGCQVQYFEPLSKQIRSHVYYPPDTPLAGQLLKVNQRMENLAAAISKAKSMLRRKNKLEVTGSFDLMGDPVLLSGLTGMVNGFGVFDGKYIISEAGHVQDRSQGYRTNIKIRKVLNW